MGKKKNHRAPVSKTVKTAHRKSTRIHQNSKPPPIKQKNTQKQYQKTVTPTIPYDPSSKILLVGEGDFSFSVSLLTHHLSPIQNSLDGDSEDDELNLDEGGDVCNDIGSCDPDGDGRGVGAALIATSYDARATLLGKYPQAAENVEFLQGRGVTVLHNIDITRFEKLPKVLRKSKGQFDVVGFMFPHVGGLSTDVGRQVKSNQGLFYQWNKKPATNNRFNNLSPAS